MITVKWPETFLTIKKCFNYNTGIMENLVRFVGGHLLNKDLPESAFLVTLKKLKGNLQTEINRVLPDATLNNDLGI